MRWCHRPFGHGHQAITVLSSSGHEYKYSYLCNRVRSLILNEKSKAEAVQIVSWREAITADFYYDLAAYRLMKALSWRQENTVMIRQGGKSGGTLHQFSAARSRVAVPVAARRRGVKTVLVVDDQHVVLELVDAFLEDCDYRVYLAGSGRQALEICHRVQGAVDLLLTDVRMPGMNGPELHERIVKRYPDVKVLFMSGFSAAEAARFGVPKSAPLIVKPFRPDELLQRMRLLMAGVLEFPAVAAD